MTVVYDAGNCSLANQGLLDESGLGYVSSLVTAHHTDLLAIPRSQFTAVEGFAGLVAHETTAVALGATRRAITTHSDEFHQKQARGFAQTLAKCNRQLTDLQAVLQRGKTRRSRAEIEAQVAVILKPRWAKRVIATELTGQLPKELRLSFSTDKQVAQLMRREADKAGIKMSVRELLRTLESIKETNLIYPSTGGRPKVRKMLTELNGDAQRLFDLFGLEKFAPRS